LAAGACRSAGGGEKCTAAGVYRCRAVSVGQSQGVDDGAERGDPFPAARRRVERGLVTGRDVLPDQSSLYRLVGGSRGPPALPAARAASAARVQLFHGVITCSNRAVDHGRRVSVAPLN
jgi:hypothetical protein